MRMRMTEKSDRIVSMVKRPNTQHFIVPLNQHSENGTTFFLGTLHEATTSDSLQTKGIVLKVAP